MSESSAPETAASGQRRPNPMGLVRRLPTLRGYLLLLSGLAAVTGAVVVAQAELLARAIAGLDAGLVPWIGAVVLTRAALAAASRWLGGRTAARVRRDLRDRLLAAKAPPGADASNGSRITLLTRGLDALDPYITGYLPQAANAAVIPLLVVGWLALTDWPSALIILATLPLIPVLGALVGWHTAAATRRQWKQMDRLGGHFLDVVTGLGTLRAYGRHWHQVNEVRRMAGEHRAATMSVLRIAFLSALVLELVAALSVALVAVPMGMRLLDGTTALRVGLVVLLLAPEAYLPLRAMGSAFHTAMDGITVAERALALCGDGPDEPDGSAGGNARRPIGVKGAKKVPASRSRASPTQQPGTVGPAKAGAQGVVPRLPDPATATIRLDEVTVAYPDRGASALAGVSLDLRPGERVALAGPSGAGKTTLLRVLLGLVQPTQGRVLIDGVDLARLDGDAWRQRLAWVPQHPHIFADTVAANIALGEADPDHQRVRWAAESAHAGAFCAEVGYQARIGAGGTGLSSGQRQRVALARAFYRDAPFVLLDEPTAHLDLASEAAVLEATADLLRDRGALLVAHRPALLHTADRIVRLDCGRPATDTHHPVGAPT